MLGFVSFLSFLPPTGISLPLPPPSSPLPLPVPCLSLPLAQLLPRRASRPREERKLALPFPRNTPSSRRAVDERRPGGARRCDRLACGREEARRCAPLPPAAPWGTPLPPALLLCILSPSRRTSAMPVQIGRGWRSWTWMLRRRPDQSADRTGMEELDMDVEKAARPEFVHPYCCEDRDSHPCVGTSKRSTPSNLTPRFRIYSKVNGAGNSRTMAIQDSWLSNYPETLRRGKGGSLPPKLARAPSISQAQHPSRPRFISEACMCSSRAMLFFRIAHLFVVSEEVSQRREIEHAMCVFSLQPEGFRCTVVIKIWSLGSHGGLLPAIDVAKNLCHMEMATTTLHVDTKERSSGFKRVASLVILKGLPGSFS